MNAVCQEQDQFALTGLAGGDLVFSKTICKECQRAWQRWCVCGGESDLTSVFVLHQRQRVS